MIQAAQRGTLYSYVVSHIDAHPTLVPPYVVAVVERDADGDFVLGNMAAEAPQRLQVGLRVAIHEVATLDGAPRFEFSPLEPNESEQERKARSL